MTTACVHLSFPLPELQVGIASVAHPKLHTRPDPYTLLATPLPNTLHYLLTVKSASMHCCNSSLASCIASGGFSQPFHLQHAIDHANSQPTAQAAAEAVRLTARSRLASDVWQVL